MKPIFQKLAELFRCNRIQQREMEFLGYEAFSRLVPPTTTAAIPASAVKNPRNAA